MSNRQKLIERANATLIALQTPGSIPACMLKMPDAAVSIIRELGDIVMSDDGIIAQLNAKVTELQAALASCRKELRDAGREMNDNMHQPYGEIIWNAK